jgi:hypothetical protein
MIFSSGYVNGGLSKGYRGDLLQGRAQRKDVFEPNDEYYEERDCENCVHRKENGCEVWDCAFEQKGEEEE